MKKLLFIINMRSGKGQMNHNALSVIDSFIKHGYKVRVHTTQGERDATRLLAREGMQYDLICVSGGDGTLNESVSGLMKGNLSIPILYLPAGSTNDFARSLAIPSDPHAALKSCLEGKAFSCDVGAFLAPGDGKDGRDYIRNFVYVAAFGAFTEVSYDTPQNLKNTFGHSAYIMRALQSIPKIKPMHLQIEYGKEQIEGEFLYGMITNSHSVGGLIKLESERISLSDGVFEVTLIMNPNNPSELTQMLIDLAQQNETSTRFIYRLQTDRIRIRSEEAIPWTIDGENGGEHREVILENIHHGITILVPEEEAIRLEQREESTKEFVKEEMEEQNETGDWK